MSVANVRELVIMTIKEPAEAARFLLSLAIPREALWIGFALVAVLNGILFDLSNRLVPTPSPFPEVFLVPVVYTLLVALGLLLTIASLYWAGRLLGGSGSFEDVMVTILWLQGIRLVLMVLVLILVVVFPLVSALVVFGASLYGLYILLHFVDQAHGLQSLGRSAGVLIASMVAIVLGLTLLVSLFGGPIAGLNANV